jgi:alkylation response protein AidB-like acyl-CoA dehydrogenase
VNFDLSEEQNLLRETLVQFAANECGPTRLRELFEDKDGHDPALWRGLAELGVAGLIVPEAFGGAGLELFDLAVATEALGRAAMPGPFFGHSLACLALALGGSDAQKRAWLPKLASGEAIGTVAFGEAGGIWQPEEWRAQVSGSSLSGSKTASPWARVADLVVVGTAGGGLALVEPKRSGVKIDDMAGVDRTRRIDQLTFEKAACEALPGAAEVAARVRDAGLVLLAADAWAAGHWLVSTAVEYAKTREQFGVTIGHFQALKHQLVAMAVEIEPARALFWYAAHAFDHVPADATRMAALAKAHLTDRAMQVARDAVEAHGGIGFTWECDVQIWFKRCLFDRAFLGTPYVHRERAAQLGGW